MYRVVLVPENRDSFYAAFKVGVKEISEVWTNYSVPELRNIVAAEVENNVQVYAHLMPDDLTPAMTAYIVQGIKLAWFDVGELEIEALAKAADVDIIVVNEDGSNQIHGQAVQGKPTVSVKKSGPYYRGMEKVNVGLVLDAVVASLTPFLFFF